MTADRREVDMDWCVDEGASGKNVNPALREALENLAAGRAGGLIVARLDRLARSDAHAAEILNLARTQGWNLIVCDLGMDLSTPRARALAQTMAMFAELERELIGARTREGLAAAKARGVKVGRPRLTSPAVVDRVCRERDAGASFGAIARMLTSERAESGRSTNLAGQHRPPHVMAATQAVA